MLIAILFGLAAALGTISGLFLGMPAVGFVLWPLTRALCRKAKIEIDPHDEDDPIMKLEGSLAAGLGMALGVFGTVAIVGLLAAALMAGPHLSPWRVLGAASAAGTLAGLTFGSVWRFGYRGHSVAPQLLVTALLAGLTAAVLAS